MGYYSRLRVSATQNSGKRRYHVWDISSLANPDSSVPAQLKSNSPGAHCCRGSDALRIPCRWLPFPNSTRIGTLLSWEIWCPDHFSLSLFAKTQRTHICGLSVNRIKTWERSAGLEVVLSLPFDIFSWFTSKQREARAPPAAHARRCCSGLVSHRQEGQ